MRSRYAACNALRGGLCFSSTQKPYCCLVAGRRPRHATAPFGDRENTMTTLTRFVTVNAKNGLGERSLLLAEVGGGEGLQGCHLHLDIAGVEYVCTVDLGGLVGLHLLSACPRPPGGPWHVQ